MVGTIEEYSSSTAATAGMAAVIVVLVLIIVACALWRHNSHLVCMVIVNGIMFLICYFQCVLFVLSPRLQGTQD